MAVYLIERNLKEAEGDYIKIGDRVIPTNTADMGNANYDTVARRGRQRYDAEKKAEEDERKRQADIERGKEYQAKLDKAIENSKDGDILQAYFDVLVPGSGKADTVAGELVRALMRIQYRDWNDGDRFFSGYGLETAMPSAAYIMDILGGDIKDKLINTAELQLEGDDYTRAIDEVEKMLIDYLQKHPELLGQENKDDSRYWEVGGEYDELEQQYDCNFELPWQIKELLDRGDISENEISWELDDWEYFRGCKINVWDHYVEVEGLTEDQYETAQSRLYRALDSWGEEWAEEYGLEDDDEDY